jgi:hypothetical protein
MFLLIRKLLICLTVELQTSIYHLILMLIFVRKVIFYRFLKEEQDLYQMVEIVPLMSTVTGG